MDAIDREGLVVRHAAQLRTSIRDIPTVDHLEPHWIYDVIFVVLQAGQLPDALPELARNHSRYIVFIGNNAQAPETEQLLLRDAAVEKEAAFAFFGVAGRREKNRIIALHAGMHLTVGGVSGPLSPAFSKHLRKAVRRTPIRLIRETQMDAWLKCHLALILPICYACYTVDGHMDRFTPAQRKAILDAALEACILLKALGIPIREEDSEDCFRPGFKRTIMELMLYLLCKTPLGRLCASDHAMKAIGEMQVLDRAYQQLRTRSAVAMPAWAALRTAALPVLESGRSPAGPASNRPEF